MPFIAVEKSTDGMCMAHKDVVRPYPPIRPQFSVICPRL